MTITVLTPTGTLGYGFDVKALERGMQFRPNVIAVDAGSTDPGPAYLGSAEPLCSRRVVKGEIELLLKASRAASIPLVIGSAIVRRDTIDLNPHIGILDRAAVPGPRPVVRGNI